MKVFINPGHDINLDSGAVNPVYGTRECAETFKSLYEKWLPTRVGIVSKSAIESYRIAYDHIQSIANMPINLIKYSDMQCVIDSMRNNGLSYASAKKVRTLLSLLSKYAIVNDIDIKDYTPIS